MHKNIVLNREIYPKEQLLINIDHLMNLYCQEFSTMENINNAHNAIENAGGMLAFLSECRELVKLDLI